MGNGYKKSKGFISFIFIKTKILTNDIITFKNIKQKKNKEI